MDSLAWFADILRLVEWGQIAVAAGLGLAVIGFVQGRRVYKARQLERRIARGEMLEDELVGFRMDLAEDPDPPEPETLGSLLRNLAWSVGVLVVMAIYDAMGGDGWRLIATVGAGLGAWALFRLWHLLNDPPATEASTSLWHDLVVPEEGILGFVVAAFMTVLVAVAAYVTLTG